MTRKLTGVAQRVQHRPRPASMPNVALDSESLMESSVPADWMKGAFDPWAVGSSLL
ncbi:MAG TPA: hypothetical protein VGP84_03995 [Gemmatimonadaceae bacterium]|nr:hypothetical protein [Gemmatimonadaceae bacterium]